MTGGGGRSSGETGRDTAEEMAGRHSTGYSADISARLQQQ